jgi:hypothetical protein
MLAVIMWLLFYLILLFFFLCICSIFSFVFFHTFYSLFLCSLQAHRGNNLVDRISDLPYELLLYILSLFPKKRASAMAILSKRWTPLRYSLFKTIRIKCDQYEYPPKERKFIVSKWLKAAIQRHIEEIHIILPSHTLKPRLFVSQSLVDLKLKSVDVEKDTSCVHLPSLKTLNLKSVTFENRNYYINFLYACPILEDLHADLIFFMRRDKNNA